MNFSAAYLFVGLLAAGGLYFAARRSAACVLRRKNIPPDTATSVGTILAAAFFIIYLAAAAVLSATLVPHSNELAKVLFSPADPPPLAAAPDTPAERGKIAAEHDRAERQRWIAETTQQLLNEAGTRRQLFGQEQSYIVAEGISGTQDRYLPPKPEAAAPAAQNGPEPETKIAVQGMVSSSADISSLLADSNLPQSIQEKPPAQQQPAAVPNNTSTSLPPPVAVVPDNTPHQQVPADQPVRQSAPLPTQQAVQPQNAAEQVSCSEIRKYMDSADMQLFQRAMRQEAGIPSPWRGPGGFYIVIPAAIKGNCREYSIQATIQGRMLRCQAVCAEASSAPATAGRIVPSPPQEKQIILNSMSSLDQDALIKALSYHGPVSWRGMSGIFYTVSPVRLGNPCREYMVQANIQGRIVQYLESNCR